MKNQLKNYLKTFILLLGVFIFSLNCEKETTIEHNHEMIHSKFKRFSVTDLMKNDTAFSKLSENYLSDKINKNGTFNKSSSNDLIITSDTVNVVVKENYRSYTIRIKRKGETIFHVENLIIEEKDGVKSAHILSYKFDEDWIFDYIDGKQTKPTGKVYYTSYDISSLNNKTSTSKSSGYCYTSTITVIIPCGCGHNYIPPCRGCSTGNEWPEMYSYPITVCFVGNIGDDDDNSDTGDDGNTGDDDSETQTNYDTAEAIAYMINRLKTIINPNSSQTNWIDNHQQEAVDLYKTIAQSQGEEWSMEAKNFARNAIELEIILNNEFIVKSTNKYPSELDMCCPGSCCPESNIYANDLIIQEYGIQPIQASVDATFNLIVASTELMASDDWIGSRIKSLMNKIGVEVPSDVENEYLAAIYQIRKRDGIIIVEYRPGLLEGMLYVGLDTLDMLSFISPSKGGGAFLAARAGGRITITNITEHIRKITITNVKIDNVVNSLQNNVNFVLDGTGEFSVVRGHHPLAKIAFSRDKFYNFQKAFSVSAESLGGQSVHNAITGQQNSLYSAFARTGEVLTLDKMAQIEIQAMVNAGIPENIATGWVIKALEDLGSQGVKMITNIPWNGLN